MSDILKHHLREGESNLKDIIKRVLATLHLSYLSFSNIEDIFTPSFPILHNIFKGSDKLPFSCYTIELEDKYKSITENIVFACSCLSAGGGVALDFSNIRENGAIVGNVGNHTNGIIPMLKFLESGVKMIHQTKYRKGSCAVYLDTSHPEISEFIHLRDATGDPSRRCHNLHTAVKISDKFMQAVINDGQWKLISPKTNDVKEIVSARDLFLDIITTRYKTGEPYIFFSDTVNDHGRKIGYLKDNEYIAMSNLCTEICIKTRNKGIPEAGVCCLGSINICNAFKHKLNIDKFIIFIRKFYITLFKHGSYKGGYLLKPAMGYKNIGIGIYGFVDLVNHLNGDLEEAKRYTIKILDAINSLQNNPFRLCTAIAPTGTTSYLTNATPCLENYPLSEYNDIDGHRKQFNVRISEFYPFQFNCDQRKYIDLVSEIQEHVHQSISCTLHYKDNININELVKDHIYAWQKKLKTLYYLRIQHLDRAEISCSACSN